MLDWIILAVLGVVAIWVIAVLVFDSIRDAVREKAPKLKFTKLSTDNPQLKYEMAVYKDLARTAVFCNDKMVETQREHIEELQKLDRASRNEKKAIEMQNFKMVKSIETFNLCCELISRNPVLMNMLVKGSEDEGVEILRRTINLDDEGFNNNKNSLRQIVCCVKKGMLTPFKNC
ncbi:MAG: hypothetical protein IJZ30_06905 [Alphaproteobacteria bacterium]|nr:hypothetical protein [Alphaproteobacteria bacterium]